jgi:hypothetical protein
MGRGAEPDGCGGIADAVGSGLSPPTKLGPALTHACSPPACLPTPCPPASQEGSYCLVSTLDPPVPAGALHRIVRSTEVKLLIPGEAPPAETANTAPAAAGAAAAPRPKAAAASGGGRGGRGGAAAAAAGAPAAAQARPGRGGGGGSGGARGGARQQAAAAGRGAGRARGAARGRRSSSEGSDGSGSPGAVVAASPFDLLSALGDDDSGRGPAPPALPGGL